MIALAPPLLVAVFLWWFGTGAILLADGLARRGPRTSLVVASLLAGGAVAGVILARGEATPAGAYVGFGCALVLWGWHEASFLMGVLTGPRRTPCPPGLTGVARFRAAAATVIHHELALAATAAGLAAATWGADNRVALWTFLILWVMRLSTKLNIYLGVPALNDEFLPASLRYLETYFRKGRPTALFAVSVAAAALLTGFLAARALSADAGPFEQTAFALTATLSALGLIEHGFMVLPVRDAALWRWALRSRAALRAGRTAPVSPTTSPAGGAGAPRPPAPPAPGGQDDSAGRLGPAAAFHRPSLRQAAPSDWR